MAFLVFCLLFLLFFAAHFALASRGWGLMRGIASTEVDMQYVRQEDYFAQSFRRYVRKWLTSLPRKVNETTGIRSYEKGPERILVTKTVQYPANQKEDNVIIVEGSFGCGGNCQFTKELLVRQDCAIGGGTRLQALAADGDLTLGPGATVARWLDSRGKLTLGENCTVASRVTSRSAIEFLPGARALSFFAPELYTEGRLEELPPGVPAPRRVLQIPHAGAGKEAGFGYDPSRLFAMGGGTFLYDGDLNLSVPVRVTYALVVRGAFVCPQESLIESDIKASGRIQIGPGSVVRGNLVSDGDLVLRPDVYFQGLLQAEGHVTLGHGCRGIRKLRPVAVYGRQGVQVQSNVVIHGKVASAKWVEAVSTPAAWLDADKFWLTAAARREGL